MEDVRVLDTGIQNVVAKGGAGKGSVLGSGRRKKLGDISNLPRGNQDLKSPSVTLNTKEYINKLHQENMALVKLLGDRNKIIELSSVELQKLKINYQKVQQQNLQLAQANSQMLGELNSGRDKLKALRHELGCKDGLLAARKLVSEEKANKTRCQSLGNEVKTSGCDESGEFTQEEKVNNNPCNTKGKRKSKIQSFDTGTVYPVQSQEKGDKKRRCSRRQSARFEFVDQEHTDNSSGINDASGLGTVKSALDDKKRLRPRRQSAKFKSEEQGHTEDLSGISDTSGISTVKSVQDEDEVDAKSLNRLSSKHKSQEQEPVEDLLHMDDTKSPIPLHDERFPVTSVSDVKIESEKPTSVSKVKLETQEMRRSSIRPKRLAVEKVQSYKEIPLTVKMRRPE